MAFLHLPPASMRSTGILFCHAFAEEKNQSHSVIVKASRSFAENGFPVFRFDMSGCGDSEGNLDEITLSDWQEDIVFAVDQLKKETNVKKYVLWGLSLGAGLAILQADHDNTVACMLLCEPVLDFNKFIHQFLRRVISTNIVSGQMTR